MPLPKPHELVIFHRGPDEAIVRSITALLRALHGIHAYSYTDDIPGYPTKPNPTDEEKRQRQTYLFDSFQNHLYFIDSDAASRHTDWSWFGYEIKWLQANLPKDSFCLFWHGAAGLQRKRMAEKAKYDASGSLHEDYILAKGISNQIELPDSAAAACVEEIAKWLPRERVEAQPIIAVAAMTRAQAEALEGTKPGTLRDLGSSVDNYGTTPRHWIPANMGACDESLCWHSRRNAGSVVPANKNTIDQLLNAWTWTSSARCRPHLIGDGLWGTTVPEWGPDPEVIRGEIAHLFHHTEKPALVIVDGISLQSPEFATELSEELGDAPDLGSTRDRSLICVVLGSGGSTDQQIYQLHASGLIRKKPVKQFVHRWGDVTLIGGSLPMLSSWVHQTIRRHYPRRVDAHGGQPPSMIGQP